jgi:hypothetical protein
VEWFALDFMKFSSEPPTDIAFWFIWNDIRSIWLTKATKIRYNELEHRVADLSVWWVIGQWPQRKTLVRGPLIDPPFPFRP